MSKKVAPKNTQKFKLSSTIIPDDIKNSIAAQQSSINVSFFNYNIPHITSFNFARIQCYNY